MSKALGRCPSTPVVPAGARRPILRPMPKIDHVANDSATYDWNAGSLQSPLGRVPLVFDDTLRDGLQNPSVVDPGVPAKCELLSLMARAGVGFAGIGMPSASPRHFEECLELCRYLQRAGMPLVPVCAARTLDKDVALALRLCEEAGCRIELHVFLGVSRIRSIVESWPLELLLERTVNAVRNAVRAGVGVAFVAEDATRADPRTLQELFRAAIGEGAERLCLCDTVGAATPAGARRIVEHARGVISSTGAEVGLDWHGHNDRGLALANTLEAWRAGADRLHGTVLGIGERVGNTPMELLLLNLHLGGVARLPEPSTLVDYAQRAATALGWPVPHNYPLLGKDAFRTATGVHAAAIKKAEAHRDPRLVECVYSTIVPSEFGRSQEVCIGHVSGTSNVVWWLEHNGYRAERPLVDRILIAAKATRGVLSDEELHRLARQQASLT